MLRKLSELVTSHPWIVVTTWAAVLLLGALGAYNLSSVYEPARYSDASESDSGLADTIVREEFGDSQIRMAYAFFIIYEAKAGVNVTSGNNYQNLLESTGNAILVEFNGKYLPIHYWSLVPGFDPGSFVSSDSRATYLVLLPQNDNFEELEIEDTARVRNVVSEQIQNVGISSLNRHAVTGSPAANTDGFEVAQESLERSDIIALLMVSAVLLFVFGSLLGIGVPLAALVAVLIVAFGALFFLGTADILVINEFIPNIVSMIGIGIVADYNLLLITRFREESQKGADPVKAARISIQTAGKAVVFSGLVVMIGFGSLLVLGDEFSFMMAWAVIITVAIAIISVITLTPAILTLTGHKLEWPKRLSTSIAKLKLRGAKEGQSFWARWSRTVQRHPWAFLIVGVIFILPIIAMASQLKLSMPDVSFIPKGTEAREGYDMMGEYFSIGELSPVRVVLQSQMDNGIFSREIISGIAELATWVIAQDNIATFVAPNAFFDARTPNPIIFEYDNFNDVLTNASSPSHSVIAPLARNTVDWTDNNNTALLTILLNVGGGSTESWNFVKDLRMELDRLFPTAVHHVGGQSATFLDQNNSLWSNAPLMFIVCMVLTFVALLLLFRSIVLPLKSIVTIMGSVIFSYGILVTVFQEGIAADLLGIESTPEGIIFFMPLFLFTIVFGLSMDYNVFILTRVKEEYDRTGDNSEAVALGIEKTGAVVTSAALIMMATFGVFVLSDLVLMQMLGLALVVVVFVDATLMRTIILPSAMKLMGRWNWYLPQWLDRILPRIDIEH